MKKLILALISVLVFSVLLTGCSTQKESDSTETEKSESKVVYVVQTGPPNMIEQLKSKEIAGLIAWEPFNTDAITQGAGKYLFTSQDAWADHPCCVIAKGKEFNDRNVLVGIIWANLKATQFINDTKNIDKVIDYAVQFTGRDEKVVREAIKNVDYIEYPKEDEFKRYYENLNTGKLLKKNVTDIGFASENDFFNSFFQADVYQEVVKELKEDPSWKPEKVSSAKPIRIGFISNDLHQLALFVAQKEGYYQEIGLEVEKNLEVKQYSNGVDIMSAFKAKEIDISYLGGAPAIMKRINDDIEIEIIAGANQEGSGLVVLPEINALTDLAGKTIAVPGIGTVQYMLLEQELEKEGLSIQLK